MTKQVSPLRYEMEDCRNERDTLKRQLERVQSEDIRTLEKHREKLMEDVADLQATITQKDADWLMKEQVRIMHHLVLYQPACRP
jgi:hypothetical protein